MGAIVLQQRPTPTSGIETRIVVDGQQRLTTLQLLIDAVQEVCEQSGYEGPAKRLLGLVQTDESFWRGNPDAAFKVWPTFSDQPAFRRAMRNELSSDEYRRSRVVAAHDYFKNAARKWLEEFPAEDDRRSRAAEALERAVSNTLELVVIDLGQTDDPHVIFETLNARGTPLLPSDMIKNQILHQAGVGADGEDEQLTEQARQLWSFDGDWWRQEIGRGYQRRPRIDAFLNHWLSLRTKSEVRARGEFDAFSKYVDQQGANTTIQSIASDIGRLGDIYLNIDQQRIRGVETFLYRREIMGIGVVIPVLMWLLSSGVPERQLARSITGLESYLVRRMACGMGTRHYGQLFIGLVGQLEDSGPECAGDTVVHFLSQQTAHSTVWPSDNTLLQRFTSDPLYWSLTAGRLNLILQGIEGELRTGWAETQEVPRNLHIEHIMPQAWRENWPLPSDVESPNEAAAERDHLIHSIGNLTLVNQRLNAALSNAPWEEKRQTLGEHTVLFLNKALLNNAPAVWDEATIVERSKRLHEAAVRVWPHAASIP